jgi:hypothetical protein
LDGDLVLGEINRSQLQTNRENKPKLTIDLIEDRNTFDSLKIS